MDIHNLLISNNNSSGEKIYKCFIVYLNDDLKISPLHIIYLIKSAYIKSYDGETKWMYFLIEDGELLKTYNNIWNEVGNRIRKEFVSEPIYNEKFLKTKI